MYGNMLQMPGIASMEWDYENRLFKAISGTVTSFYNYDAGGERARKVVEKTGQNIKEVRIYFSNFEVYRKYVNDVLETERTTLHISDGQRRIAFFESLTVEAGVTLSTPQDTVRYQYDNHLGSASLELDQTAATISYEEYHPFGTSSYRLHRNSTEASLKRYRYVGKERDEETGLYYYGARYYAAHIARFVSVDSLAKNFPWNSPYSYAENQPISCFDLDGLEKVYYQTKYKETWRKVFQVLTSNETLKKELYDPITKDKDKDKVEIYFAAKSQETLGLFFPKESKKTAKGIVIPWLGSAASWMASANEEKKKGVDLNYEKKERFTYYNEIFNKLGLETEDIAHLALKHRQGKEVYLVLLSEEKFDFELKEGKGSLKSIVNSIAHEIGLHLINDLNHMDLSAEDEHDKGFGIESIFTPDDKEIPKNTMLGKWFEQINQTINQMYKNEINNQSVNK